jgi:hypothetical protein
MRLDSRCSGYVAAKRGSNATPWQIRNWDVVCGDGRRCLSPVARFKSIVSEIISTSSIDLYTLHASSATGTCSCAIAQEFAPDWSPLRRGTSDGRYVRPTGVRVTARRLPYQVSNTMAQFDLSGRQSDGCAARSSRSIK